MFTKKFPDKKKIIQQFSNSLNFKGFAPNPAGISSLVSVLTVFEL